MPFGRVKPKLGHKRKQGWREFAAQPEIAAANISVAIHEDIAAVADDTTATPTMDSN